MPSIDNVLDVIERKLYVGADKAKNRLWYGNAGIDILPGVQMTKSELMKRRVAMCLCSFGIACMIVAACWGIIYTAGRCGFLMLIFRNKAPFVFKRTIMWSMLFLLAFLFTLISAIKAFPRAIIQSRPSIVSSGSSSNRSSTTRQQPDVLQCNMRARPQQQQRMVA